MSDKGTNGKRRQNGAIPDGKDFILGLDMMVRLHAIENIPMTPGVLADFERFEREGLAPEMRHANLLAKYVHPRKS